MVRETDKIRYRYAQFFEVAPGFIRFLLTRIYVSSIINCTKERSAVFKKMIKVNYDFVYRHVVYGISISSKVLGSRQIREAIRGYNQSGVNCGFETQYLHYGSQF